MTSPGSVILVSYIKKMRNLGVAATAGRTNALENEISYMTKRQRSFAFAPKYLPMYFTDHFLIKL